MIFFEHSAQAQLKRSRPLTNPAYDLSKNRIHFGFSLGINIMDAEVANKGIVVTDDYGKDLVLWTDISQSIPGFNVNIISELRISSNFSLRILPGMAFGQRTFSFYKLQSSQTPRDTLYHKMKIESSMIEIPILFKYSANRHADYRPYLIAGVNPRIDLASRKKFSEDVHMGLKQLNVYGELGFGVDFYLPFFKFSTELKYSRGFMGNLSSRRSDGYEFYPTSIDGVISDIIVLTFNFE